MICSLKLLDKKQLLISVNYLKTITNQAFSAKHKNVRGLWSMVINNKSIVMQHDCETTKVYKVVHRKCGLVKTTWLSKQDGDPI